MPRVLLLLCEMEVEEVLAVGGEGMGDGVHPIY
jgi:hypothetical protein